jgi:hypothetical protein
MGLDLGELRRELGDVGLLDRGEVAAAGIRLDHPHLGDDVGQLRPQRIDLVTHEASSAPSGAVVCVSPASPP